MIKKIIIALRVSTKGRKLISRLLINRWHQRFNIPGHLELDKKKEGIYFIFKVY